MFRTIGSHLDYTKFYHLEMSITQAPFDVELISPIDFPTARLIARGETPYDDVIQARATSRGKVPDYLLADRPGLELFSERFFEVLQTGGFTGWSSVRARVEGIDAGQRHKYLALVIRGRSGDIDYALSERLKRPSRYRPPTAKPRNYLVGTFFPSDTWDGSDIFLPGKAGHVFVTERVKQALDAANISGIGLTRLDQAERSDVARKAAEGV